MTRTMNSLRIAVDRLHRRSLAEQIHDSIATAIREGHLYEGARLPSWHDLATQLSVARGTVKTAYERLADDQLVIARGAAGTFVASPLPAVQTSPDEIPTRLPLPELYRDFDSSPKPFQVGVPASDMFPYKVWSRTITRYSRLAAMEATRYHDPRGERELRKEVAAYLSVARGLPCSADQVIITNGYAGALGLALHALELGNRQVWVEDPGYPLANRAISLAGYIPVPISVDTEGLDVAEGLRRAPDASLAIVTASQQAPLGVSLSLARRCALLQWAAATDAWVIEDDYLSELKLSGKAAPALASLDGDGRVIHIGTFSKTISPTLRLGFMVVPSALVNLFGDVAAALSPASSLATQLTVAAFMRDGYYLRHIRRMKRLYAQRRDALLQQLGQGLSPNTMAGLSLLLTLPDGADDVKIAEAAEALELAPAPLSTWYADNNGTATSGLLLGVTNLSDAVLESSCRHLEALLQRHV
ncbi:MocR-like pyridoxine biosynthesis transcription factor PdxR [Halomonas faecis]|uniref:MocR-like pyridoxine biosynthesis transcription factor PdxR n=1 Tax=Halomonas faecis TaxID=1562110 RepID=UPI001969F203|nr:PLP-dependent aminotransferase family protein [Halomonas faecis]